MSCSPAGSGSCVITFVGVVGGCSCWSSRRWRLSGSWSPSIESSTRKRRGHAPLNRRSRRVRGCSGSSTAQSRGRPSSPRARPRMCPGPRGSWLGAAGVADTSTCARMPVDARMRLESVSKIYTATLILQLAQAGRLRVGDTVARWLPGLLPYGNRITIRQLLTMSSGLIDNNDLRNASAERAARQPRPRQGRRAAGAAARDRRPRQRGSGDGVLTDLVDQVRRLAAAAVHAGRRVPLLEHRLRHPRPDRRPRRRQAPARALPRADLRAARPPRDRLRPARPDQRPPRPRLRDRARRPTDRHDRLALRHRRRRRHRLQRQGHRHLPHRPHARQAARTNGNSRR